MDVQHKESSKISIKLFLNGKFQSTGCRTIETMQWIPKFLENLLNNKIIDMRIALMNGNIETKYKNAIDIKNTLKQK